jgi:single-strand DNA-binding protein
MIIGRIGKDPETKYTQSGVAVCNISVATDEGYVKDGQKVDKTEWHRVVLWNKQAEFCQNYLGKGRLVYIEGSLETQQWQDQQGQKRYTTQIKGFKINPLDPKPQNAGGGAYGQAPGAKPAPQQQGQQQFAQPQNQPPQGQPQGQPQQGSFPADNGPVFPSEVSSMDDCPF